MYGHRHGSILFKFYCCVESVVLYSMVLSFVCLSVVLSLFMRTFYWHEQI